MFFEYGYPVVPAPLLKGCPFLSELPLFLCKKSAIHVCMGLFLHCISFIYLSQLMLILCSFDCCTFIMSFDIRQCQSSSLFFLFRIVWLFQSFIFPHEFWNHLVNYYKTCCDCIEAIDQFEIIDILTIFCLLTPEQSVLLPLFQCSLISLSSIFQFSVCVSFRSFIRFIPKYFIFLLLITLFLNSNFKLFLAYKNMIDSCMINGYAKPYQTHQFQ